MPRPPRPGDIGLVSMPGPTGLLIRAAQWLNGDGFAHYEHVFLVLDNATLIEAMPGGARIAALSEYDPRDVLYVAPMGLTDAQRAAIVVAGRAYLGVPYSWLDYLALAAHRLHLPIPGLRRYVQATGHMICSQLVDQAYHDAGVHLFDDGRWPGYVTPGDLYRLLGWLPTRQAYGAPGRAA